MEMLRVTSLEEIAALPLTKWNIRQHRSTLSHTNLIPTLILCYLHIGPDAAENALSSGGLDLIVSPGLGFNKVSHMTPHTDPTPNTLPGAMHCIGRAQTWTREGVPSVVWYSVTHSNSHRATMIPTWLDVMIRVYLH